jgi:rubrerythrin
MLEPYQKKIIELLYKQEILLSKFYKTLSVKFPEYGDFWKGLAKEELKHAEWIKKLYQAEKKDLVAFSEGKVKTYTLNSFIENLEKTIRRAENDELNLKTAIAYTLDFERSLIEKNTFSRFEIVEESIKGIMTKLESETKRHVKKAQDIMGKVGKPGV